MLSLGLGTFMAKGRKQDWWAFFGCNFRSIQKLASSDAGKLWPKVIMCLRIIAQKTSGIRVFFFFFIELGTPKFRFHCVNSQ